MRARNLKPSIFRNELLAVADPLYTVTFAGLWCMADRAGRLEDRPAKIHLEVNPGRSFDGTNAALTWLAEQGFIVRYEAEGRKLIQVVNFSKHQNPHCKEPASTIPAPCEHSASTVPAVLIPDSGYLIPDSPSLIPDSLRSSSSQSLLSSSSEGVQGENRTIEKARIRKAAVANVVAADAGRRRMP